MREFLAAAFIVGVIGAAWVEVRHNASPPAETVPSIGAARAYCETGHGFRPCATVEPDNAET